MSQQTARDGIIRAQIESAGAQFLPASGVASSARNTRMRTKSIPTLTTEQEERFWSQVDRRFDDQCWNWLTYKDDENYGYFFYNGMKRRAHRIAYTLIRGVIPDGLTIDHICMNRSCCNPAHMDAITIRENILRSETTLAGANIRKTHCSRGHLLPEPDKMGYRRCSQCARRRAKEFVSRLRLRAALTEG